jgi:hypothetical protein
MVWWLVAIGPAIGALMAFWGKRLAASTVETLPAGRSWPRRRRVHARSRTAEPICQGAEHRA